MGVVVGLFAVIATFLIEVIITTCGAIADPAAGGEVLFIGTVRDHDADKGVIGRAYSAHPSAEAELRKVTESPPVR